MAFLIQAGILEPAGNIQPQTHILRGEIAEMLHRMLDRADLL
jgi:hypothetical protein